MILNDLETYMYLIFLIVTLGLGIWITWIHRHAIRTEAIAYSAWFLIEDKEEPSTQEDIHFNNPYLYVIRILFLCFLWLTIFMSQCQEDLQNPEGTLIILNGPISHDQLQSDWPRPWYFLYAHYDQNQIWLVPQVVHDHSKSSERHTTGVTPKQHKVTLNKSIDSYASNIHHKWIYQRAQSQTESTIWQSSKVPIPLYNDIPNLNQLPLNLAPVNWSLHYQKALTTIQPQKVIHIESAMPAIMSAQAQWIHDDLSQLQVDIHLHAPWIDQNDDKLSQILLWGYVNHKWIKLGGFNATSYDLIYRWTSQRDLSKHTPVSQLSGIPLFIQVPHQAPWPVCSPLQGLHISTGSWPTSVHQIFDLLPHLKWTDEYTTDNELKSEEDTMVSTQFQNLLTHTSRAQWFWLDHKRPLPQEEQMIHSLAMKQPQTFINTDIWKPERFDPSPIAFWNAFHPWASFWFPHESLSTMYSTPTSQLQTSPPLTQAINSLSIQKYKVTSIPSDLHNMYDLWHADAKAWRWWSLREGEALWGIWLAGQANQLYQPFSPPKTIESIEPHKHTPVAQRKKWFTLADQIIVFQGFIRRFGFPLKESTLTQSLAWPAYFLHLYHKDRKLLNRCQSTDHAIFNGLSIAQKWDRMDPLNRKTTHAASFKTAVSTTALSTPTRTSTQKPLSKSTPSLVSTALFNQLGFYTIQPSHKSSLPSSDQNTDQPVAWIARVPPLQKSINGNPSLWKSKTQVFNQEHKTLNPAKSFSAVSLMHDLKTQCNEIWRLEIKLWFLLFLILFAFGFYRLQRKSYAYTLGALVLFALILKNYTYLAYQSRVILAIDQTNHNSSMINEISQKWKQILRQANIPFDQLSFEKSQNSLQNQKVLTWQSAQDLPTTSIPSNATTATSFIPVNESNPHKINLSALSTIKQTTKITSHRLQKLSNKINQDTHNQIHHHTSVDHLIQATHHITKIAPHQPHHLILVTRGQHYNWNQSTNIPTWITIDNHEQHRFVMTNARAQIKQQQAQIHLSIQAPYKTTVRLYINKKPYEVPLESGDNQIFEWVNLIPQQSFIKIKMEFYDQSDSSIPYTQELILALKSIQAPIAWTWGHNTMQWLRSMNWNVESPNINKLNQPIPKQVGLIILASQAWQRLQEIQQRYLVDWVESGGTLWIPTIDQKNLITGDDRPIQRILPMQKVSRVPQSDPIRVIYLIDRSGSMDQSVGGIGFKNIAAHLTQMNLYAQPQDECMFIAFGGGVEVLQSVKKIKDIKQIPLPKQGSGSTLLAPALDLAAQWHRMGQKSQWVIISDGQVADQSALWNFWKNWIQRHQVDLYWTHPYDDTKEQGLPSIIDWNHHATLSDSMKNFMRLSHAQVIDWQKLQQHIWHDSQQTPQDLVGDLPVRASDLWVDYIGGAIPNIKGLTMSQAKQSAQVLASVKGYPALLRSRYGAGQVLASMTSHWNLDNQQWKNLFALADAQQLAPWDIYWRNGLVWAQGNGQEVLNGLVQQNVRGRAFQNLQWCPLLGGVSLLSQQGDCHLHMGQLPNQTMQWPILDLNFTYKQRKQHHILNRHELKSRLIPYYDIQQYAQRSNGGIVDLKMKSSSQSYKRSNPFMTTSSLSTTSVTPKDVIRIIKNSNTVYLILPLILMITLVLLSLLWDVYRDYKY
jgi:hypothetical protein